MKSAFQIGKVARREKVRERPMRGQAIHDASRNISKGETYLAIACVSAAGESLTPCIITSQDSPSVREKLKKHGVEFGTDLIMKSNAKPYINVEIFLDYVRTVLIPKLGELRRLVEFAEEMPVLLMDNCSSHITWVVM
jgi:hypothetical protein